MFSIIQMVIAKIIAALLFIVTVVFGGIAGLIGLIVRGQLPDTQTLADSPTVAHPDAVRTAMPAWMAVATASKPDKKRSARVR